MSNLTILNTSVRQFNNLYSLNDLHRLSGGESKHQPTFFVRLDTTKELVVEIQKEDPTTIALQSNNGGVNRGTYACEELVIAYAMWISPKFHLVVLRAFIAMRKAEMQNSTAIQPVAADLQQIIQTAVQKALPPQMPLYQARNLHEVLPLAALYSKACTLAKDFKQLYKFLQQKGYGAMAEICLNHAEELNEHTALMAHVDGCIQILMQDLSDKDQEFIHRLFLK